MRLPLIVSGVSKKVTSCAVVRVPQGNWRIVIENWIDSTLILSPIPKVGNNIKFQFKEPTSVQLCISDPGSETNLNVYLEKLSDAEILE